MCSKNMCIKNICVVKTCNIMCSMQVSSWDGECTGDSIHCKYSSLCCQYTQVQHSAPSFVLHPKNSQAVELSPAQFIPRYSKHGHFQVSSKCTLAVFIVNLFVIVYTYLQQIALQVLFISLNCVVAIIIHCF